MDSTSNINSIKRFDVNSINKPSTFLLIGKRGSGKTYSVCSVIDKILSNDTDNEIQRNSLFISSAEERLPFYRTKYPHARVEHVYSNDVCRRYLSETSGCKGIVVFDDCLNDIRLTSNATILYDLVINKSAYEKYVFVANQYVMSMPMTTRDSFDNVILFKEPMESQKRRLNSMFCRYLDYSTFSYLLDELTNNYGKMVIRNNIDVNDISDRLCRWD
jgi:hypothetical protein